ncbi:MAG TPA: hypothetical protein VFZ21_25955 [Gemmatimonadaceae bacterium]|nr:hypothetical protein [Gemmatimonadaceae bacterium]
MTRRIAWGATLRRWLTWALLAWLVSVSEARPKRDPDRDKSAEVKRKERQVEERRKERERHIQECMDDRDGDPDADREICEDEVP